MDNMGEPMTFQQAYVYRWSGRADMGRHFDTIVHIKQVGRLEINQDL